MTSKLLKILIVPLFFALLGTSRVASNEVMKHEIRKNPAVSVDINRDGVKDRIRKYIHGEIGFFDRVEERIKSDTLYGFVNGNGDTSYLPLGQYEEMTHKRIPERNYSTNQKEF